MRKRAQGRCDRLTGIVIHHENFSVWKYLEKPSQRLHETFRDAFANFLDLSVESSAANNPQCSIGSRRQKLMPSLLTERRIWWEHPSGMIPLIRRQFSISNCNAEVRSTQLPIRPVPIKLAIIASRSSDAKLGADSKPALQMHREQAQFKL